MEVKEKEDVDVEEHPGNFVQQTANHSVQSSSQSLELGLSSDNLTFTKAKIRSDEERLLAEKGQRRSLHLSALLLVLSLSTVGAILLAIFWTGRHEVPFDYAMVFDAGSTHTEMVVYKWQADKFNGTGVVSQVTSCDMSGGIGVVLRTNPAADAPGYFQGCVSQGLASIPEARHSHSPVFLAATAGMRLVRSENPDQAEQILGNVSRALEQAAAGMLFSVSSVRVITGQEEAVAGWISANYLLRTIFPKPTKMVGMLDMGGASTQITFLHHNATSASSASVFDTSLRLYGATHELYARSYMCLGQEQLLNRYLVLLVKDHYDTGDAWIEKPTRIRVMSPCHNSGFNYTISFEDYVNVCSETRYTDDLKNVTVRVEGGSDANQCRKRIQSLLDTALCNATFNSKNCFAAPSSHPPDTNFVAVSGFYYVMQYLGFTKEHPSLSEFTAAATKSCNMSWDEVVSFLPGVKEGYASKVCFNSQYQAYLFLDGYGIKDETWKNIVFLKKVNGTSVGWTLGFTIRSTNAFPDEPAVEPFSAVIFTSLMFILAVFIGICLTLCGRMIIVSYCKNNQISVK